MRRHVWLVVLLVALLTLGSGCLLTTLVEKVLSSSNGAGDALIEIEIPTPQRATVYPTLTPKPTATGEESRSFRVELTESDISELVGEEGFSAQGLQISNLKTTITKDHVIATFNASHAESGLSGEMTVIGVPHVADGKVYLEVIDFGLGKSFSGFARLIASALVQSVLDSYNTGNGIPVPIDDVGEIASVELFEGKMVVTGTYR